MNKLIFSFSKIALLIIVLPTSSCKKSENESEVPNTLQPGYFVMTELRSSQNRQSATARVQNSREIDLGEIRASKEFDFILTNGGGSPIFDVTLEVSNNEDYTIYPQGIDVLASNSHINYGAGEGFLPIVTLGVRHGINLDGIGYDEILEKGLNLATLKIKGKTLSGADTINLESEFEFSITALLMDIKYIIDGNELDFSKNYYITDQSEYTARQYNLFTIFPDLINDFDTVEIENSGNVDILIQAYSDTTDTIYNYELSPNEKALLPFNPFLFHEVSPSSNKVVVNHNKFTLQDNGKINFRFDND